MIRIHAFSVVITGPAVHSGLHTMVDLQTLLISVSFVIDVAALKTSLFNIFLYFSIDDSD